MCCYPEGCLIMAILKYLDLSTAHMTEADSNLLTDFNNCFFRVLQDEYGFFVSACNASDKELKEGGFSADFIAVCKQNKTV